MRITTKGRYALRAMTNLALSESSKPKPIKIIAAEEDISPEFLEQIFFRLKKAEIIQSVRGPGGGFMLHMSPDQITVKSIFEAVDEGLDLSPCTTCTDDEIPCTRVDTCLVHNVWKEASDRINAYFESVTLQKIMDQSGQQDMKHLLEGNDVRIG
jgi:Rrf2 family iron-sulfur cluster assembly transcriptional regulator